MNTLTKIIAAVILILAITVLAIYIFDVLYPQMQLMEQAKALVTQAKDYVTSHWIEFTASAGTIATVGGAALSQVNKAKEKVTEIKDAATNQFNTLTEEKDKLTESAKAALAQKDAAETELLNLKEQYANFDTVVEGKNMEIERLKSQIDGLSKQNVDKVAEDVAKKVSELNRKA
jgi:lipopolysaccharide export LptBFGC system permease protein LptF